MPISIYLFRLNCLLTQIIFQVKYNMFLVSTTKFLVQNQKAKIYIWQINDILKKNIGKVPKILFLKQSY